MTVSTLRYPRPASRVLHDTSSLRRGNILLEFISAYGLQVALIAGALVLLSGAYALIGRTSTATEVRQITTAAQALFGKTTGTYAGITTKIVAASAQSGTLPRSIVEGDEIFVHGGELPVYIHPGPSATAKLNVPGTKYFSIQIGDNSRNIEESDLCSDLARLQLPRLHSMQIRGPAVAAVEDPFIAPAGYAAATPVTGLTVGDSVKTNVLEFGDDENNSKINATCNQLVGSGVMILYLIN